MMIAACDSAPAVAPKPEAAPPAEVAAKPAEAPAAVAAPPVEAPPVAAPPVASPPAPPVEEPLAGSGPSGAEGRAARRQAVLDLLTDGRSAAALDVIAASPGRSFDPELADAMTPKVYIKSRVPQVRQLKATVEGPLDKDIVRRIVRAHINEIRSCYNKGLARDPKLAGRVEVAFVILDDGKVGSSTVRESTISDAEVASCAAKTVRRWTFPKPGQIVKVIYPFALEPG